MADLITQLCKITAEILQANPEEDLVQLVSLVKQNIGDKSYLDEAIQSDCRLIQLNEGNKAGFQTLVTGGIAKIGIHLNDVDPELLQAVLRKTLEEILTQLDLQYTQHYKQDSIARIEKLEGIYRGSIASCKDRFLTVIGDAQKAEELANDFSLGLPPAELNLHPKNLLVLTGDFGVGKTLIVQRIFQNAIQEALKNSDAPVPIYLDADTWRQDRPLQSVIEDAANELGDIKEQGAVVIIDELDKASMSLSTKIVGDAYVITEKYNKTKIFITSRPIQHVEDNYKDNLIHIPPLSSEQSHHLIERVLGQELDAMRLLYLEASVKEVIIYPLFALLLARYGKKADVNTSLLRAELLSKLVEDALKNTSSPQDSYQYLIKLATRYIEFGNKPVALTDIDLSRSERQNLLDSRLVVERSGNITFPLSIFAQWFAFRGLEEDPSQIEKYLDDTEQLENWRYVLIIAVGSSNKTTISKILTPIIKKHPSFAVEIIRSSLLNSLYSNRESLPSLLECGEYIRTSMSTWVSGIGHLAKLITPIREDGELCPVGVAISHDTFLESAWYVGGEEVDNVKTLPLNFFDDDLEMDKWRKHQGRRPIHQSAWGWLWTLNTLRSSLISELSTVSLPINQGILSSEASWRAGLAIFQNWQSRRLINPNLSKPEKFTVNFLAEAMSQIDEDLRQNIHRTLPEIHSISDKEQNFCLDCLRQEIKSMQAHNISDFSISYTDVDLAYKRMRWNSDSDKISDLKKRVEEVYKAALDEYQNLSQTWFDKLLSGMQIAGMLPTRLVGVFTPPVLPDNQFGDSPQFDWYLEPLPKNSQNKVEIEFSENIRNNAYETYCKQSNFIINQLRNLRPNSSAWLRCNPHGGYIDISLFSDAPVTVLVYSWLEEDLRSIGWIDDRIQYRSRLFR